MNLFFFFLVSGLSSANVPPPPRSSAATTTAAAATTTTTNNTNNSSTTGLSSASVPPPPPNRAATSTSSKATTTTSTAATTTATTTSNTTNNTNTTKSKTDENSVEDAELEDATPVSSNRADLRTLELAAAVADGRGTGGHEDLAADPIVRDAIAGTLRSDATPVEALDRTKHASGIKPTLQNIVSTVNLGVALDLKAIALHARNAEYNPKRFSAVIMRIRDPKTTALIFASGKMVCTGAKSEDDSKLAARKYARIIQKLGFEVTFTDFKVQNIVASADIGFPVRLEGLAQQHSKYSSYEPELFPGLIYRMLKPKVVLLIFVSGKIVLTGAKTRDHVYESFELIYTVLRLFRKQPVAASAVESATQ